LAGCGSSQALYDEAHLSLGIGVGPNPNFLGSNGNCEMFLKSSRLTHSSQSALYSQANPNKTDD